MLRVEHIRALVVAAVIAVLVVPALGWASTPPVTHYTIDVNVNFAAGTFIGSEDVVYWNTTETTLDKVVFRIYPNSQYLYGPGTLRVDAIHVQGAAVTATPTGDLTVLPVNLPRPLPPQSRTTIAITFTGELSRWSGGVPTAPSDYGIYAASAHTLTLASFYPILAAYTPGVGWERTLVGPIGDAVTSDIANYDVTVTVPAGVVVVGSGERTGITQSDNEVQYQFVGRMMRDFMLVVGDNFATRTEDAGNTRLTAYFRPHDRRAAATALEDGTRAIAIYDKLFGPCDYPKVDIVKVQLARDAGVAYPGLILVAADYCADPSTRFFSIIISHELAHQWWYAAVGNDVSAEPWLDEALATYSSVIYLEKTAGPRTARAVLAEFCEQYQRARATHPGLAVASPTYRFPDDAAYSAIVYSGGACFLNAIRSAIGDNAFFTALSEYYRAFKFRRATAHDLLTAFTHACGCDLDKIYTAYLKPAAVTTP